MDRLFNMHEKGYDMYEVVVEKPDRKNIIG
jgi:hypothetical protein